MEGLNCLDTPDGGIVSARSQAVVRASQLHLPHYLPPLIPRRRCAAAAWHPAERITLLLPVTVVLREPPDRE
jgi:hypothetical protein